MYFYISTWVSATMRLGFYMHGWFVRSLKEPSGIAPQLSIAGLFLCVLTENGPVLSWEIDRWVVKLHEPFTEYVNIGKPSLYSHIMKPPIHHCPVEKGFATSCFLWNIIWGQQFFHVRNSNSMHQILAKIQIHMQPQGHVYNLLFPMIYCDCHGCKFLLDLAVLGYKPISHAFG